MDVYGKLKAGQINENGAYIRNTKAISLKDDPSAVVVQGSGKGFSQSIEAGKHELKSDEPLGVGGMYQEGLGGVPW